MVAEQLVAGQMVSLGGYPSDWLVVDRVQGKRLRLRRFFGNPVVYSAGFWIDAEQVREVRWPDLVQVPGETAASSR
jgi:hypothetical protein